MTDSSILLRGGGAGGGELGPSEDRGPDCSRRQGEDAAGLQESGGVKPSQLVLSDHHFLAAGAGVETSPHQLQNQLSTKPALHRLTAKTAQS